jgi:hypothetical protein
VSSSPSTKFLPGPVRGISRIRAVRSSGSAPCTHSAHVPGWRTLTVALEALVEGHIRRIALGTISARVTALRLEWCARNALRAKATTEVG